MQGVKSFCCLAKVGFLFLIELLDKDTNLKLL